MKVSVIIPAYNAARTIAETMDSVISQTFMDWELLVVDDCSSDETKKIVAEYCLKDKRIVSLSNSVNSGVSASRNLGIKQAKGEWIAFLDADDIWINTKLAKQIAQVEQNKDIFISYTATGFMNENGKRYGYIMPAIDKTDYTTILHKNIMSCSSVMVRANLMKKYPMPHQWINEDYYSWLFFLKQGYLCCGINEPLLIYRINKHSESSSRIYAARRSFRTYRAMGYSLITTLFYVGIYIVYSIGKRRKIFAS